MKPPICCVCRRPGTDLFKFADYQPAPPGLCGHPAGAEWICGKHIESARELRHLSAREAVGVIRERDPDWMKSEIDVPPSFFRWLLALAGVQGFRLYFHRENRRPHVCVGHREGEAIFSLVPEVDTGSPRGRGMSAQLLARARAVVLARLSEIRAAWERHLADEGLIRLDRPANLLVQCFETGGLAYALKPKRRGEPLRFLCVRCFGTGTRSELRPADDCFLECDTCKDRFQHRYPPTPPPRPGSNGPRSWPRIV